MTYRNAVREFKRMYVGLYINQVDYWTAQQAWAEYTDSLCKSGQITEKQYMNWTTPFPYGKPLPKPRLVY
jgi:hypothetical protein